MAMGVVSVVVAIAESVVVPIATIFHRAAAATVAIAPAGATTARIVLSFTQGAQLAAGAAWWDDVTFAPNSPCDTIDFNRDGVFPSDDDLGLFISVLAGDFCPSCGDIDFNNNGVFPEDQDIADFLNVLAGGECQ
jgi:hypothetical protein